MAFDPDKYLAKTSTKKFDPDAYLGESIDPQRATIVPKQDDGKLFGLVDTERPEIQGLKTLAKGVDVFTGAAGFRAGLGKLTGVESDKTFFQQALGKNTPTGKEIASQLGASEKPIGEVAPGAVPEFMSGVSPAGFFGFGIDAVADPFLPAAPLKSALRSGTQKLSKGLTKIGTKSVDFVTGTQAASSLAEGIPKGIGKTIETTKGRIDEILKPTQATDFEELKAIAQREGIPEDLLNESIEFGDLSVQARQARDVASGPGGQKKLESYNELISKVNDSFDNKVKEIGQGDPMDLVASGDFIKEAVEEGFKRNMGSLEVTHNNILEQFPSLTVKGDELKKLQDTLLEIKKDASRSALKSRGVNASQLKSANQAILRDVDEVLNMNPSYSNLLEELRAIREGAFDTKNPMLQIPKAEQTYRKLYRAINESLTDAVAKINPNMADELVQNNNQMKLWMDEKSNLKKIGNLSSDEVISNIMRNVDNVSAVKSFLDPNELQQVKGAVLESLIKRDSEGAFTFKSLHNAMRNKKAQLGELFEPQELQELADIIRLGDRAGAPLLPGSAGQVAFDAERNPLAMAFRAIKAPAENIALETGKARARMPRQTISLPGLAKKKSAMRGARGLRLLGTQIENQERN